MGFHFTVDGNQKLLDLYITGAVLSYVAICFNLFIFIIFLRKKLLSPATILMQGLAISDGLTATCLYGLEPLLEKHYLCVYLWQDDRSLCEIYYPYCNIATDLAILTHTAHSVSVMLTTAIGIQKVIAIRFPLWTKLYLTNIKAALCCFGCYIIAFASGLPRHFVLTFKSYKGWHGQSSCIFLPNVEFGKLLEYYAVYFFILQTFLMSLCAIIMVISTIYLSVKIYKDIRNGRQTERRRQERRSIIMVVMVLAVFLASEIPRIMLYIWFTVMYFIGRLVDLVDATVSRLMIRRFEDAMARFLAQYLNGDSKVGFWSRFISYIYLLECMKLFTVIGCISNFIIYLRMSTKLRNEIKTTFLGQSKRKEPKAITEGNNYSTHSSTSL